MNKGRAALAVVMMMTAGLLSGGARAQAPQPAPLLFDDFLFDNARQPANAYDGFFLWNVTGGSVDLVGGNLPGAPGGPPLGRYVDLGGSTGDPGLFRTRLSYAVTPGTTYNLTFDYRSTGGDLNAATAFVGDRSFTVSTASTDFTRFSSAFTFDAAGLVNVSFQGLEGDADGSGIGIDVVQFGPQLIPGGAAVPEPAAWATMIAGVGAIGGALRRRPAGQRATA